MFNYLPEILEKMSETELYQLEQDEELRIEVDCPKDSSVTVELKQV